MVLNYKNIKATLRNASFRYASQSIFNKAIHFPQIINIIIYIFVFAKL